MLNEEQIDKLKLTMSTDGWNEVILPLVASRGREAITALVLDPTERSGEYKGMDDGMIRQRARAVEWLLSILRNELAAADHNRALDELDRQNAGSPPANP
jgi:hypothetical protein